MRTWRVSPARRMRGCHWLARRTERGNWARVWQATVRSHVLRSEYSQELSQLWSGQALWQARRLRPSRQTKAPKPVRTSLEPTPGIEPGTSFLPTISLLALWHTPVDCERNASHYGVVGFPGPVIPGPNDPKRRLANRYDPKNRSQRAPRVPDRCRTEAIRPRLAWLRGLASRNCAERHRAVDSERGIPPACGYSSCKRARAKPQPKLQTLVAFCLVLEAHGHRNVNRHGGAPSPARVVYAKPNSHLICRRRRRLRTSA